MPLVGGAVLGILLPDSYLVQPERRAEFALFTGIALSISALPVIAKTLLDLGLVKTDVGALVLSVATVDDLVGWLAFSVLVGPMRGGALDLASLARAVGLTACFTAAVLVWGPRVLDRLIARLEAAGSGGSRRVLSLVVLCALFGASFTQWAGVHAVFGGFVVGVALGVTPGLETRTRDVIRDFVTNIFAPVFFASIGLRTDFARAFNPGLCVLVFPVATATKVIGCALGARAGGLGWRPAVSVGFGLNARGAMEVILALVALEAGLVRESVFVALVLMALGTSLLSGPMMTWLHAPPSRREPPLAHRGLER